MKATKIIAVALAALLSNSAAALEGVVVSVSDGDTIIVLDETRRQHKIRLVGIDAPEKAQPYGNRSKQNLAALVFQRQVTVDWQKRDKYKRILGKVFVAEPGCSAPACPRTMDANLAQVKAGFAWWYREYAQEQPPQDRDQYQHAELQAKSARDGLWRDPMPQPPWEWRKANRIY